VGLLGLVVLIMVLYKWQTERYQDMGEDYPKESSDDSDEQGLKGKDNSDFESQLLKESWTRGPSHSGPPLTCPRPYPPNWPGGKDGESSLPYNWYMDYHGLAAMQVGRECKKPFQKLGVAAKSDGSLLPLFGRPVRNNINRYQYYLEDDSWNKNRVNYPNGGQSTYDMGIQELQSGDTIQVPLLGGGLTVTMYPYQSL